MVRFRMLDFSSMRKGFVAARIASWIRFHDFAPAACTEPADHTIEKGFRLLDSVDELWSIASKKGAGVSNAESLIKDPTLRILEALAGALDMKAADLIKGL